MSIWLSILPGVSSPACLMYVWSNVGTYIRLCMSYKKIHFLFNFYRLDWDRLRLSFVYLWPSWLCYLRLSWVYLWFFLLALFEVVSVFHSHLLHLLPLFSFFVCIHFPCLLVLLPPARCSLVVRTCSLISCSSGCYIMLFLLLFVHGMLSVVLFGIFSCVVVLYSVVLDPGLASLYYLTIWNMSCTTSLCRFGWLSINMVLSS